MKRLRLWLFVALCLAALTVGVSAAGARVETMDVTLNVDENGTARAESSLHVVLDDPLESFSVALGPDVSGVHLDGYEARISHAGDQTTVTISSGTGLPSAMDLHLTYTIRNTVQPGSDTQHFSVRLLGGIKDADIAHFSLKVQMPASFEAIPEFSSGYYADGIDNYLTIRVTDEGCLTASTTETLLAGETLDLKLETEPDYFILHNVAGRTLLFDRIAMSLLVLLGFLYWWRALRFSRPKIRPRPGPPMGVEPGVAGMLMLAGQKPDLSLMALGWAANGYIRITRLRGGRVMLSRMIPMGNERSAYEQAIFHRLFAHVSDVSTSSNSWIATRKKANKIAKNYWNSRLYEKKHGHPALLRTFAVLFCGFAALSCGDWVLPSMHLRILVLASIALAGVLWGLVLQYALRHLPLRRRKKAVVWLMICLAVVAVAWHITGHGGPLLLAVLISALTELVLLSGPKRKKNGAEILTDLLSLRRYLRTLSSDNAKQLLKADPQYYYKTLLYAEALGVGKSFSLAFDGLKLVECAFFDQGKKPIPRQPDKFREYLLEVLAIGRGEPLGQASAKKPSPSPAPHPVSDDSYDHEVGRNNNPRRKSVEAYEPEDFF